jgi:hypothetical protein
MNYEPRPLRRGLLPNLSSDIIASVARLEYSVFTRADCSLAWKVLTNVELWPKFCRLYKHIRWQGTPWTPGSRVRVDLGAPVNSTADRVVTVCSPPHHVSWINHISGYTMEQWVSLDPFNLGGTRVSVWIEVTGGDPSRDRAEDMRLLQSVVVEWFDNFWRECDLVAQQARSGDIRSEAD